MAAIDRVLYHLNERDSNRSWAREIIDQRRVVGVDIDANAVNLARLRLWQRLLEEPGALPLPSLSNVIRVGDGLNKESWGNLDRQYDVVLGNPPFLATSKVESRDQLEARFVTARGRFDFSSLFVEQGIGVLQPRGHLGMVVPNRFFRNTSGAKLRALIASEITLRSIVDFGSTRPFEADAYVACLVGQKRLDSETQPRLVKVIEVRTLNVEFLANLLLDADKALASEDLRTFLTRHPAGAMPWFLISEEEQAARVLLEDSSVKLDNLAFVAQGIRTGANEFFLFEVISDDGSHLCELCNGLGETILIERELLRPVIQGSEVQRYSRVSGTRRLLYPYRNRVPISEAELELKYPNAWDYFLANRNVLGGRASLQKSGGQFYELVRPRDEAWLDKPKLLIRDLAPRTSFAMDDRGGVYLVGGTSVAPHDAEMLPALMAYLNSSFIDNHVRQSTPGFQGGYQKFEPQHLQSIPVLERFVADDEFQNQLSELAWRCMSAQGNPSLLIDTEREIDRLVTDTAIAAGAM